MQAHPPDEYMMGSIKIKSHLEINQGSTLSRLGAVEGTLYLYKSILSRNTQKLQEVINKIQSRQDENPELDISQKRLKLHQELLNKIEEQRKQISEIVNSFSLNKTRKESLQILADTYAFIQDIENLITLEDLLQSEDGASKSKTGFESLFLKYGIIIQEAGKTPEKVFRFDGITLTQSSSITKSEIPNFERNPQIPISC